MKLKKYCLGVNFDDMFNTIGTSPIMMQDKNRLENLNLNLKIYLKRLNLSFKP